MFKRIIRNLSNPYLLLMKIVKKIVIAYASFNYNKEYYSNKQEELFSYWGLTYIDTVSELKEIYKKNPLLEVKMSSCHHNLFLALSKKHKFKNILEIGTHTGAGAVLLSTIFPEAKITTIDLPDDHSIFSDTYNRSDNNERSIFINDRNTLLATKNKVEFKQMNSLELSFCKDKYDLIWLDGAHGYPVVTCDIVNSLRLVTSDGFILCDDVWKSIYKSDEMYSSIASYETINALSEANLLNYSLIYKRVVKPLAHPKLAKYIAILQKK